MDVWENPNAQSMQPSASLCLLRREAEILLYDRESCEGGGYGHSVHQSSGFKFELHSWGSFSPDLVAFGFSPQGCVHK